ERARGRTRSGARPPQRSGKIQRVHPIRGISVLISTIVVAAIVGFGIRTGWLWIGAQVQGSFSSTSLDWSVAMLILFGMIISYLIVLYIAGFVISVLEHDPEPS